MDNQNDSPLLCDPKNGVCELPHSNSSDHNHLSNQSTKTIHITYYTDPICSSCWGIEPQLRRLKLEYGKHIEIEYKMGGLLPDWSYNSGGISQPSDVAKHWDEVSKYYNMPIDGDVWIEDPLDSSYPPSIAFKAAQIQDRHKAQVFLRRIKEMVFIEKKNITRWEHIVTAANHANLDTNRLKSDFEGAGRINFQDDLNSAKSYGIRGFPTLIFSHNESHKIVYGFKPYQDFEKSILQLNPEVSAEKYDHNWEALFATYETLTTREFAELTDTSLELAEQKLTQLVLKKQLTNTIVKNGILWKKK